MLLINFVVLLFGDFDFFEGTEGFGDFREFSECVGVGFFEVLI